MLKCIFDLSKVFKFFDFDLSNFSLTDDLPYFELRNFYFSHVNFLLQTDSEKNREYNPKIG